MSSERFSFRPLEDFIEGFDVGVSVNGEDRPSRPGEHGVLKVSSVSPGRFVPSENKAVLARELDRLGPALVRGDILVTRANTHELVGAAALVSDDYPLLHLSDKTWRLRLSTDEAGTRRWLVHALNSRFVRTELRRRATGTSGSMKNISQNSYLRIEVPCPPAALRGGIADALDAVSRREEAIVSLIGAKRRLKGGLMQQLLTAHRRLPGYVGAWPERRLGDVFLERSETGRTDLPLLSITAERGVLPRDAVDRRDTSNDDKSLYLRIAPGDIGYNTMRMWQGVCGLSTLEGIVSPAYTVCSPSHEVDGRFAAILFKFPPVIKLFRRNSQGLVDDTLSLKFHHFAQIRLPLPPPAEQRAIADVFVALDREIHLLEKLASALNRQKRLIVDKLLSGELHLSSA
jgi:type I restriction enzyme, S subunit